MPQASASNRITRTPAGPSFKGVRVNCLEALRVFLGADSDACVATDLSLGAWYGCQAARELESQLQLDSTSSCGIDLGEPARAELVPKYADFIGRAIDAESDGNRTIADALQRAMRIAAKMTALQVVYCLVLIPRFDLPWEEHDTRLVQFLAQAARGMPWDLLLVGNSEEDPVLPPNWFACWHVNVAEYPKVDTAEHSPIALVPGVAELSLASLWSGETSLFPLRARRWLVAPELRRAPSSVPQRSYDKLAVAAASCGWLHAYAQVYGNNLYVDPQFLCEQSVRRLAEGGGDIIAVRLAERATACARGPEMTSMCQSYTQGIRIAMRHFRAAADAPDPPFSGPPSVRGFLLQCKGWGMACTEARGQAETYLAEARRLMSPVGREREFLYLLNISALAALRTGDLNRAFELEHCIEKALTSQGRTDWHLRYINSINLARLQMRRNNLGAAAHYYRRAFETAEGVRSDSDAVYFNVCLGRLYMRQQSADQALRHWMRACLHWLSSATPEALAPRVAQAILGGPLHHGDELVERVSCALVAQLVRSADGIGIDLERDLLSVSTPVFIRRGDAEILLRPATVCLAAGIDGYGVSLSRHLAPEAFRGTCFERLRVLVGELLRILLRLEFDFKTVVVDDRFGREIPATAAELASASVGMGLCRMRFGPLRYDFNRAQRWELEMASRVKLGTAIDAIDFAEGATVVWFKRYLAPVRVAEVGATVLHEIDDGPPLEELARRLRRSPTDVLDTVRALERRRIVNVDVDDESWKAQRVVSSRV